MNLYISGLDRFITEDDLRPLFEKFGKIKSIRIAKDPGTKESLCYGFVEMEEKSAAIKALSLNAATVKGTDIKVNIAKVKSSSNPFNKPKFGRRF